MAKPPGCPNPAVFRRNCMPAIERENNVSVFEIQSVDQVILAILTTAALREILPVMLPTFLAGPDGWLLRIEESDQ